MVIFGYIVYLIICIWVTLVGLFIWCYPSGSNDSRAESWGVAVVLGLMYYGVYHWFPFTIGVK